MKKVSDLHIKIFADGAEKAGMLEMYKQPFISGFTTNPTLMNKVGIKDYRAFAQDIVKAIPDRPISFEVFADDFAEMERQAGEIATWGEYVYIKDSSNQYESRTFLRLDPPPHSEGSTVECDCGHDNRANGENCRSTQRNKGCRRFHLRRTRGRHRPRPGSSYGGSVENRSEESKHRATLGFPS